MKLWVDDVRPAPNGYLWCKDIEEAKYVISMVESQNTVTELIRGDRPTVYKQIDVIDVAYNGGDYTPNSGDVTKLYGWFMETGRHYTIRTHKQHP